jgi:cardiolipin synthase (CMP-forming)
MTAIGFLLAGSAAPWWLFADDVGWYGLWLAAGLTVLTGLDYLVVGLRHSTAPAPPSTKGKPAARPATIP